MAFAPVDIKVSGSFTEKEFGNLFEFYTIDGQAVGSVEADIDAAWAEQLGATHLVFIGTGNIPGLLPYRYAKVKKTAAYIAVDEDENGIVWEKWDIKWHRMFC